MKAFETLTYRGHVVGPTNGTPDFRVASIHNEKVCHKSLDAVLPFHNVSDYDANCSYYNGLSVVELETSPVTFEGRVVGANNVTPVEL